MVDSADSAHATSILLTSKMTGAVDCGLRCVVREAQGARGCFCNIGVGDAALSCKRKGALEVCVVGDAALSGKRKGALEVCVAAGKLTISWR